MKNSIRLILAVFIVSVCFTSCSKSADTSSSEKRVLTQDEKNMLYGDWRRYSSYNEQNATIEVAEPTDTLMSEERDLTQEEKDFAFGKWRIKTFLGYPVYHPDDRIGDDNIIGKVLIIEDDYYSSMELSEYDIYPCEFTAPVYKINYEFSNTDDFYGFYKIDDDTLKISYNDKIKNVYVITEPQSIYTDYFFIINNDRLVYCLGGVEMFELEKVE